MISIEKLREIAEGMELDFSKRSSSSTNRTIHNNIVNEFLRRIEIVNTTGRKGK